MEIQHAVKAVDAVAGAMALRTTVTHEPTGPGQPWWWHVTVWEVRENGFVDLRAEGYTEGTRRDAESLAADLRRGVTA